MGKVFESDGHKIVALEGIDLDVYSNELLVLLGPSGCGKSTLLYLMAGLLKPSHGKVVMSGGEVVGPSPDRGIVFQEFALYPWLTVKENISFGLNLSCSKLRGREEVSKAVANLINLVGLSGFEKAKPHQLSGGMKQRVALARCLAPDPQILLMDEPFGALDAQTRSFMQKELMSLFNRTRKTIVFVTHSINEAVLLADRVALLTARPGRIKEIVEIDLPRERWNWKEEFGDSFLKKCSDLEELLISEIDKGKGFIE